MNVRKQCASSTPCNGTEDTNGFEITQPREHKKNLVFFGRMSYLYGLRNFAGLKMKGKKSICSAESAGKSKREVTNSESKKNSSAV